MCEIPYLFDSGDFNLIISKFWYFSNLFASRQLICQIILYLFYNVIIYSQTCRLLLFEWFLTDKLTLWLFNWLSFAAVRCFQLREKYWYWTLPRIRTQIELSSTFVYEYKMSTSGSSARNSHLTQGGRTTMMTMPVNRITSVSYTHLTLPTKRIV